MNDLGKRYISEAFWEDVNFLVELDVRLGRLLSGRGAVMEAGIIQRHEPGTRIVQEALVTVGRP